MRSVIGFHKPEEFYGFLSNWYLSEFRLDGINFSSVEQYMMFNKAMIFNDNEAADLILSTSNVGKIKSLGRSVSNYNDLIWNGMRQIVVYKGLVGKFSQSDELLKRLINTGDGILAECSVQDVVWGIGLSMSDPNVNDLSKWCGQNLLGFTLMLVRKELS